MKSDARGGFSLFSSANLSNPSLRLCVKIPLAGHPLNERTTDGTDNADGFRRNALPSVPIRFIRGQISLPSSPICRGRNL